MIIIFITIIKGTDSSSISLPRKFIRTISSQIQSHHHFPFIQYTMQHHSAVRQEKLQQEHRALSPEIKKTLVEAHMHAEAVRLKEGFKPMTPPAIVPREDTEESRVPRRVKQADKEYSFNNVIVIQNWGWYTMKINIISPQRNLKPFSDIIQNEEYEKGGNAHA